MLSRTRSQEHCDIAFLLLYLGSILDTIKSRAVGGTMAGPAHLTPGERGPCKNNAPRCSSWKTRPPGTGRHMSQHFPLVFTQNFIWLWAFIYPGSSSSRATVTGASLSPSPIFLTLAPSKPQAACYFLQLGHLGIFFLTYNPTRFELWEMAGTEKDLLPFQSKFWQGVICSYDTKVSHVIAGEARKVHIPNRLSLRN